MNDRFFCCTDCKTYVNACGRWCARSLEDRQIVSWRQPVDVDRVLADKEYWDDGDPAFDGWEPRLRAVREFVLAHRSHHIVFLIDNDLRSMAESELFKWLEVGWKPKWTPRYFVEVLRMERWSEVETYMQQNPEEAAWFTSWLDPTEQEAFRREFDEQLALRVRSPME